MLESEEMKMWDLDGANEEIAFAGLVFESELTNKLRLPVRGSVVMKSEPTNNTVGRGATSRRVTYLNYAKYADELHDCHTPSSKLLLVKE